MSTKPDVTIRAQYAGRWVAFLRGRVVAQGATREQALAAARALRFKEMPELIYMPDSIPLITHPLLDAIRDQLPRDQRLYLVGGAVRDALLQRPIHDLDFAVPQGALRFAKNLANQLNAAFYPLDETNDTARIVYIHPDGSRDVLDFAGFRGADLESDLRDRDFTINAMAMDVYTGELFDPLQGARDLREKRVRACAETAFSNDPVRVLRAVRQAAGLGLTIEPQTRQWMKQAVPSLPQVSAERLRDELFKMLAGPQPDACVRALDLLGVLPHILPELGTLKGVVQSPPHVYDVWNHTLAVVRHLDGILSVLAPRYNEEKSNADLLNGLLSLQLGRYRTQIASHLASSPEHERSPRSLLFFAALYHDIEKPSTGVVQDTGRIRFFGHEEKGAQTVGQRAFALRLSNQETDRVKAIVQAHMRVHGFTNRKLEGHELTPKAIYRFFRDTGSYGIDVILLTLADLRATGEQSLSQQVWSTALDVCRTLLEAWCDKAEELVRPPQLLNGNDLMSALGLPPGREIGQLLELIRENQAAGEITTRDEALAFARDWLNGKENNSTK